MEIDDFAGHANHCFEQCGHRYRLFAGHKVKIVSDCLEALKVFRAGPDEFDLVITDMTMPHMPGDILAQKIMEIRPDIPVIICPGHSKRISKEKAKEMGIKGFLMKPLNMWDLASTVRRVLDEK